MKHDESGGRASHGSSLSYSSDAPYDRLERLNRTVRMFENACGNTDAAWRGRIVRAIAHVNVPGGHGLHERRNGITDAHQHEVRCATPVGQPKAIAGGVEAAARFVDLGSVCRQERFV